MSPGCLCPLQYGHGRRTSPGLRRAMAGFSRSEPAISPVRFPRRGTLPPMPCASRPMSPSNVGHFPEAGRSLVHGDPTPVRRYRVVGLGRPCQLHRRNELFLLHDLHPLWSTRSPLAKRSTNCSPTGETESSRTMTGDWNRGQVPDGCEVYQHLGRPEGRALSGTSDPRGLPSVRPARTPTRRRRDVGPRDSTPTAFAPVG